MDKPAGLTSHDVVARVRRALRTRAVGHTGTLDPFATGLLVVLVGRATRLARFVEQRAKTYRATARLGVVTSTDDLTGEPLAGGVGQAGGDYPGRPEVASALAGLLGPQKQRPPAYSAKKVAGERSYARARRGEAVELAAVEIVVEAIELLRYDPPEVEFVTTVSPGTYVRALGRDLGERLGTGAHLTALRRLAIGDLSVEQAVPLERVTLDALRPPAAVLGHLGRLEVDADQARELGHGRSVPCRLPAEATRAPVAALTVDGGLIAVGRVEQERFRPEVVLEPAG